MKFALAAIAAIASCSSTVAFSGNDIPKANVKQDGIHTNDRRKFLSKTAFLVGGAGFFLPPSEPANAYFKDGKRVNYFGNPSPLYEALPTAQKAYLDAKDQGGTTLSTAQKAYVDAKDKKLVADKGAKEQKLVAERGAKEQKLVAEKGAKDQKLAAERGAKDSKLVAGKGANEAATASAAELEAKKAADEEKARLESLPPDAPRVLVLGGTGTVGKKVRTRLEEKGFFVVATSRDGRDNTLALDVTKCYGKIETEIQQLAKENRCSAVVSLIGATNSGSDSIINGVAGQAALGASQVQTVRNFVTLGPSPSIRAKIPKGLNDYVNAKVLSEDLVTNKFNGKEGMAYTIINPGSIGKSKNYGKGKDKAIDLDTIVDAVLVGATGYYFGEKSEVLNNPDDIKAKANKIGKFKELKKA